MAKAELQAAQAAYDGTMNQARDAERAGKYSAALVFAVRSWEFVEDMMRFERKFESAEFKSLPCIDMVLRLAPVIFHVQALEKLAHLLRTRKSVDRFASDDLAARLAEAHQLLAKAHRLWDHIEQNPGVRQNELRTRLGGDQDEWRMLTERWELMELIQRTPDSGTYCLRITTNLDDRSTAICSACGAVESGRKGEFLYDRLCSTCGRTATFVLRASNEPEIVKG